MAGRVRRLRESNLRNIFFAMAIIFSEKSIPVGTAPIVSLRRTRTLGRRRHPEPTSLSNAGVCQKRGNELPRQRRHTESYLFATRCQPSAQTERSRRPFLTSIVWRALSSANVLGNPKEFGLPYNLLERKFDWFFFFASYEFISLNDAAQVFHRRIASSYRAG